MLILFRAIYISSSEGLIYKEILVQFFRGKGWVMKLLQDSGNDTKSGKLFSGMGGRFHPESVAGLFRNGWQF
jgi:hypothetical protein